MSAGEPTLGEVARTLERFERTTDARFGDLVTSISLMVTRDLYEAHRTEYRDDITQLREELKAEREHVREELKADRDRKASDRRMVVGALISAGLAVVVAIITTWLKLQGG
ncbi:hypothetical protein [Nonomuraea sediminis]|uniref:hypothetical protein n=1 Tax=Nonomuraea sediminis TaxID=2835864 RepID=UPI001BDBFC23|nr:hypothetical protein [Nonomuraea sediminis]